MNKLLYKVTVIVLKILPMLLAFITLLNSILSYFNIDLVILSNIKLYRRSIFNYYKVKDYFKL